MEKTYHILQIFDYKGGELCTSFNLNWEDFIKELGETLGLYNYFEDEEIDYNILTKEEVYKRLDIQDVFSWVTGEQSSYGGGENCWTLYECNNNIITEIGLTFEITKEVVEKYVNSYYE